jgi:simple sugar transport system permease protein
MTDIFSEPFVIAFILGCITGTIPLMIASFGETIGEQSGVLNLGIEGMMLIGGYVAFVTTLSTGSFPLGLIAGTLAGVATSVIMMVLNTWLGLNQIVIGLAITLAGGGITGVLYNVYFTNTPRLGQEDTLAIPFLSELPYVGKSLFTQSPMFYLAFVLAGLVAWMMIRTNVGLRFRAAGQNPNSLDAAGGNVVVTRSVAVLLGGAFSGLGGAYLAIIAAGTFTPFMTHGLGYIAIVVTMLARGRIMWVILVSFLYGVTVALGTVLQLTTFTLPTDVIKMFPFIVVMVVLIAFARGSYVPPALGEPYTRGAR